MAKIQANQNATKNATTTSNTFSSRSEQLQPLEREISGEDQRLKEQEEAFKYKQSVKEAALLKTLWVAELATVYQSSTYAGRLGSNPATSLSIINFGTLTKIEKDHPVHRRPKSSSRQQSMTQPQMLNQEAPRKQTTTKDSKAPQTVLGILEHQPRP